MTLETDKIDTEITKLQFQINMLNGQIVKGIKSQDKRKKKMVNLVERQKSLQAAKANIAKFNKAG